MTVTTHSERACHVVGKLPPNVFAMAVRDAVLYNDFGKLEKILPGVRFEMAHVGIEQRSLIGHCADGSIAAWAVGTS